MKAIRNFLFSGVLALSTLAVVTTTSCNKDECKDVVCQNGGSCVDGTCQCPTGYEGSNCQTTFNSKYVGIFTATETCGGSPSTYQVTITADPNDPTRVLVNNLGNYGCTVGGNITFTGTVTTATLTINDNKCSTQMNATGTLNSNGSIAITYTATYGTPQVTDNCTATLVK